MRFFVVLATTILVFLAATGARCQTALQTRVPLDESGRLVQIDRSLAERLRLFVTDYPDFESASLWQARDSSAVLEIHFRRDGHLTRELQPLAPTQLQALRRQVSEALRVHGTAVEMEADSGRPTFLLGTTLLGLGLYSWAVPAAAEAHGKNGVALGLVTAAVSFFGPYYATRSAAVTPGIANLALYGGTRGILHGVLAIEAFEAGDGDQNGNDDEATGAVIGSVLEATGGYLWARQSRMTAGTAAACGVGGDLGLLYGIGLTEVADGTQVEFLDLRAKERLDVGGLAGAAGGLIAGRLLANRWHPRWGDAEIVRTAALVGALAGLPFADRDEQMLACALGGSALGLTAGLRLARGYDFSPGQALLIDASSVAGGVLGAGVAYLVTHEGDQDGRVYAASGAIGAMGGYAVTYWTQRHRAHGDSDGHSSWNIEWSPQAALGWSQTSRHEASRDRIVTIRHRF